MFGIINCNGSIWISSPDPRTSSAQSFFLGSLIKATIYRRRFGFQCLMMLVAIYQCSVSPMKKICSFFSLTVKSCRSKLMATCSLFFSLFLRGVFAMSWLETLLVSSDHHYTNPLFSA